MQLKTPMLATGLLALALCAPVVAQDVFAQEAALASSAEKFEFKLDLKKGDKFAFRQSMDMNQDIDMGGMQIATVMAMTSDYSYEVTDVAESGDMSINIKFGRIKGSFENPMMGALEFDSEEEMEETGNPMVDMMGSMFTANAGQELTLVMNEDGDVVSVDGVDEMVDRLLENNPMAAMGGQLDAETMKQQMKDNFEGQLGQIPADPVAVGESWTSDRGMSAAGGMGMQMSIKSTLKSLSGDEAVIDSDITGELSGGQMAAMMQVEEFKGTSNTTLSVKDGLPLSSVAKINMTATMGGQGGIVMSIDTKLERIPVTASAAETPSTSEETPSAE